MAETLGSLCDKLTIVKLKQYHSDNESRLQSLNQQSAQLQQEIDEYVSEAISGHIPPEKLTFVANKVFKKEGNETKDIIGNIGSIFSQLADINCRLWHEVEKGYDIKNVAFEEKDDLVKMLAVLNLERNQCIDAINLHLLEMVTKNK